MEPANGLHTRHPRRDSRTRDFAMSSSTWQSAAIPFRIRRVPRDQHLRTTELSQPHGSHAVTLQLQVKSKSMALSAEHRSVILQLAPSAFRKTFTLREFARVLSGAPLENAGNGSPAAVRQAWLAAISEAASLRQAGPAADDDVTDPFREGPEVYRKMAEELVPAVDAILTAADSVRRRRHAGSP